MSLPEGPQHRIADSQGARRLLTGSPALAAVLLLAACVRPPTYPQPWQWVEAPQYNRIAATLAQNRVSGCGEFWFKLENGQDRGVAAVACLSRDPVRWRRVTVFYETRKVNEGWEGDPGPMPDPDQ